MDTKWIPAAPLPDWKSWNNRARELAGFKGWLEKFALWLCLVHDSYTQVEAVDCFIYFSRVFLDTLG